VQGNLNFNLLEQTFDKSNNLIKSTPGSNTISLNYDTIPPQALSVTRTSALNTIPGWAKTGDSVAYTLQANKGLLFSDLLKEDGYTKLLLNTSANTWSGTINADRLTEGYYNPQIRLIDYAGNKTVYLAQNYQSYALGDFRVYIDNTTPNQTNIDTSSWGGLGGIKGSLLPSLGRTNPQFVTNQANVVIKGQAEANQRVELDVNNKFLSFINVSNTNCHSLAPDKITADNLTTKYGSICDWSYTYQFPGDGKADDGAGAPFESYIFQVRTLDAAANYASFSPQQIVYHDTNPPITPQITNAKSNSYNPIPSWQPSGNNGGNAITKDSVVSLTSLAERFSDLEYTQYFKGNQIQYLFLRNSASRLLDQSFNLGTTTRDDQNPSCISLSGNRRVGTCSDGLYSFSLKSTDAAGNPSASINNVNIERDTVAPADPSVSLNIDSVDHYLTTNISGESNAKAIIKLWGAGQSWDISNSLDNNGNLNISDLIGIYSPSSIYTIDVQLADRAGNISNHVYKNVTTPSDGFCYGTGGNILDMPLKGNYVPSQGGGFYAIRGNDYHAAQDFTYAGGAYGKNVYAAAGGNVTQSFDGNHWYDVTSANQLIPSIIDISHPSLGLVSHYLHLSKRFTNTNNYVTSGTNIGQIGNTGEVYPIPQNSNDPAGAHLHFAVSIINPNSYLTYNRVSRYGSIYINPLQVLATKCVGQKGSGSGGTTYQSPSLTDAKQKFVDFINTNLTSDTQISHDEAYKPYKPYSQFTLLYPKLTKIADLSGNLIDNLSLINSCGIWSQKLGSVMEKNGGTGYVGALYLNPFDVKIYLVKSGIYDKYNKEGGPCSDIGVPKDTGGSYTEKNDPAINAESNIKQGAYQRYQTDNNKYTRNSIYWSYGERGYRCYGIGWCVENINNTNKVIKDVVNQYENLYGTSSSYGFPTGDTYNLDCGGAQSFESGSINLCRKSNPIEFIKVDDQGKTSSNSNNDVMIIDPKSKNLDFKVAVGLSNKIYAEDINSDFIKNYLGKKFNELVTDDNAKLNGQLPFAAFNADFIQADDKTPFGLDVSRRVEYSGPNKNLQYSLGISINGDLTMEKGLRGTDAANYNIVGGYGRFYDNNNFIDLCNALGFSSCHLSKKRSLAATTSNGYLIILVNNDSLDTGNFKDIFKQIASDNGLGYIMDGLAFDGGNSPAFRYNYKNEIVNGNNIGSALLIYLKP